MRKLKIIFCLTFLISITLSYSQNTSFAKWYDFGYAEAGYCVQQTPDSGFVVCGRQGIWFSSSKIVVMKTDKNGVLEWSKLFGNGSNDQYAYHIVNCSAGGYAAVGYRTGIGFKSDIYVLRLDNFGDTIWTRQYGSNLIEEGTSIKETSDNGFAISFWDENDSTGILKIDSAGNFQWWKHYYLYNGATFRNISVTTTGDYILSGGAILTYVQGVIMKANSMGDSIWVRHYGSLANSHDLYEAQETQDGNIIATGGASTPSGLWGTYVLKIDMNGDTIWTKSLAPFYDNEIVSIQQCNDAGYIVGGTKWTPGTSINDGNMYIEKLDQNGDTLWTKQFGGADADYGYYVRQTFDGGYIIAGMTSNWDPSGAGIYLVKTDSVGFLVTGINENIPVQYQAFSVYPNPFSSETTLKATENFKNATLTVYNSFGQLVKQIDKLSGQTITLHRDNLPSGLYFIRLTQDSKTFSIDKLVITD